jgi:hypothetical protein
MRELIPESFCSPGSGQGAPAAFFVCIFIDMTDCILVFLHSKCLSLHYSCKVHLETDKYLPWLTLCDACMAQEKPKNRTQRWSFDGSFHTDHKETWVDKKAEDGYKIGGPTTWPSHEANALCQFTWQYSVSMYISPEGSQAIRIQPVFWGYLVFTLKLLIKPLLLVELLVVKYL